MCCFVFVFELKDLQQQKEQIELNTSNLKAALQRLQVMMPMTHGLIMLVTLSFTVNVPVLEIKTESAQSEGYFTVIYFIISLS